MRNSLLSTGTIQLASIPRPSGRLHVSSPRAPNRFGSFGVALGVALVPLCLALGFAPVLPLIIAALGALDISLRSR